MLSSSIVIGGVSALYLSDWTDLVPSSTEFVVNRDAVGHRQMAHMQESRFFERDQAYFEQFIRPNSIRLDNSPIPVLSPAWALADAWLSGDWRPGPDDLEYEALIDSGAIDEIKLAFKTLGVDIPRFLADPVRPGVLSRN